MLNDDLIRTAEGFIGVADRMTLIRDALRTLIEWEGARRLALLEGTMPGLKNIPRGRPSKTNRPRF